MKSKYEILPFVFVGTFFEYEYILNICKVEIPEENELELSKKVSKLIIKNGYDFDEDYKIFCVSSNDLNIFKRDGVFIGCSVANIPEHMSIKRFKIDVRELLIKIKLLHENSEPHDKK
jgi:hypothetical protein